jgi:hypothetical protein
VHRFRKSYGLMGVWCHPCSMERGSPPQARPIIETLHDLITCLDSLVEGVWQQNSGLPVFANPRTSC